MHTPQREDIATPRVCDELGRAVSQLHAAQQQAAATWQALTLFGDRDPALRAAAAYELAVCMAVERIARQRVDQVRREQARRAA